MKKFLMVLALMAGTWAMVPTKAQAQYLDGSYLADASYGAPGDTVVVEVKAQIEAYNTAREEAESLQKSGGAGLQAAQQACVDTALYSWVQACYLAEIGRMLAISGDKTQAVMFYKSALEKAKYAQHVDCHEDSKTAKSKEQGAIIEKIAARNLSRFGAQ